MPSWSIPSYWPAVLLVWRGERPCFAVAMMKECDLPGPTRSTSHLGKVEEGKFFESTKHWKIGHSHAAQNKHIQISPIPKYPSISIGPYYCEMQLGASKQAVASNCCLSLQAGILNEFKGTSTAPFIHPNHPQTEMPASLISAPSFQAFRPPSSPWGVWPLSRTPRELAVAMNRRPVDNSWKSCWRKCKLENPVTTHVSLGLDSKLWIACMDTWHIHAPVTTMYNMLGR